MKRSEQYQAIRELTDAVIDGEASTEQAGKLKQLLANNSAAQDFYFDYVGVHTRLKKSAEQNIEFVYRRITEEEFIMRPAGQSSDASNHFANDMHQPCPPPLAHHINAADEPDLPPSAESFKAKKRFKWLSRFVMFLGLIGLFILLLVWARNSGVIHEPEPSHFYAVLFNGEVNKGEFGQVEGNKLLAGEYNIKQKSSIGFLTGETLNLAEHSIIKLLSNNSVELKQGALSIVPVPNNSIAIRTQHFTLHSNGDALFVDIRNNNPTIKSGKQTLFTPHRWRPNHYWSFDGQGDRAIDMAGKADGIVYAGATRTKGLIGAGAFMFDNSADTRLNLGSGGGSALGTGSFSATDGVTIEAMVKANYSGKQGESDHIFRKGQSDGQFRMLLSFQHDQGKNYLRPKGEFKQSLSFGLFILGQGYHELKLPLDGLEGRPTLAEINNGKAHHIVATYNAHSGLKSLYINGVQHASYQYPPGSKMLSGGAGQANIGNSPTYPRQSHIKRGYHTDSSGEILLNPPSRGIIDVHSAAFNGVIDEVAFYDFALPAFMVQHHYVQIQQGLNYFGLPPNASPLPNQVKLPLPAFATIQLEPKTGQPNRIYPNPLSISNQ
ncbi:LamG domain-containing protein [Algibacillus agarilyticus]|uniref:LamG domain-containing protein n=1 Tax=Algibacillus agarilyticus TaxID=2234133 RepID=UPI000DCFAD61|nr:LamG domain-containing protein [Algibacillus agarilyticus]